MNEVTSSKIADPVDIERRFSLEEDSSKQFSSDEEKLGDSGVSSVSSKETPEQRENSDVTVRRVLSSYEIGSKLRALRLKRKIALVDLGKQTGLSASMLSQLENGKLIPTLPTLARIALVFDVGLDHFFGDRKREKLFSIMRAGEHIHPMDRISAHEGWTENQIFAARDKSMFAYLTELPRRADEPVEEHSHEGTEFLYVIEGTVSIRYHNEDHVLNQGDSVYFDSSEKHSYRGLGRSSSKMLLVTTPPRQ